MPERLPWEGSLGATPLDDGTVRYAVWAPTPRVVEVRARGRTTRLEPIGGGMHEAVAPGAPGDDYVYLLDGRPFPDPCSRHQPRGVRGPSRVLDRAAARWTDADWRGVPLGDLVVYELHVGTFTPEGTFDAAIPRLPELAGLGVTAVDLMPVATFPGERNWGYDGLYTWAPHAAYGGPEGLDRLVDAAHGAGLAVHLDVVYNHLGPGADALEAFGPYRTERYTTDWGPALNYDGPDSGPVREWAIQNAEMWVREHHVDGFRLDAIHAIDDSGARHVVAELAARVHRLRPSALVIAESGLNDPRVVRPEALGGWGCDAQWADDFHHALHSVLTGERDGYYVDYGRVADLARCLRRPYRHAGDYSAFRRRRHGAPADDRPVTQFVVFAQNHDQVGNRARGDRPPSYTRRLAAFCVTLSPFLPLLFMGEEYGEERPFMFFTGHIDPRVAEATREGRRREFATFAAFAGEVPDPQDPATFQGSKLHPEGGDPAMRVLYGDLLRLRRRLGAVEADPRGDESERTLHVRRGEVELAMNFSDRERVVEVTGRAILLATHEGVALRREAVLLPPWSAAAVA